MTDEQMKETMATFQKDMMAKQAAAKKATGEKNTAEGQEVSDENKTKEGVKTPPADCNTRCSRKAPGQPESD